MLRQTTDAARSLSSLVCQMPVSVLSIERQLRKCKTAAADYCTDKTLSFADALPNSKAISSNTITQESISENRTPDSGEHSVLPASDCDHYLGMPTDGVNTADASIQKGPPELPVGCCMSGCPNCVWIQFAVEMAQHVSNGNEITEKLIQEIEDPSMKAFLMLELNQMQKPS